MAGVTRSWAWTLAVLLLAASAELTAWGQSAVKSNAANGINDFSRTSGTSGAAGGNGAAGAVGSLAGKLTDLYSVQLAGATVVMRNVATGAEQRTTTARNGSYRFVGLKAGEYTLEAESDQLGHGRLEGIVVSAGYEVRLQTAMEFVRTPVPGVPSEASVMDAKSDVPHPINRNLSAENPNLRQGHAGNLAATRPAAVIAAIRQVPERPSPATPDMGAEVASEPLLELGLSGRPVVAFVREMPATMTPMLQAKLESEPQLEFALSGREIAELPRRIPKTFASAFHVYNAEPAGDVEVVTVELVTEPLQGLALTGTAVSESWAKPSRAAARDIDPVAPVVSTTMTAEQLQALPVSGRRWQDFVLDTPMASTGGGSQTSLRGAGLEPAETTVDGTNMRLAFGGAGGTGSVSGSAASGGGAELSGMGQGWAGRRGFALGESAIREVRTVAGNVEAKEARAAGGRLSVETERGGNGLHGQGFLFDRQNIWGAQNPFTQWVKESAPSTEMTTPVFTPEPYTPPDHEMTWGVGLGGRIRRNKLFWFAALDGYQRNDPGVSMVKHPEEFFAQPSNDQMQVLSARLGLSSANPVAAGLAAYSKMLESLGGLLGPAPRTAMQWVGFGRIDWVAAERHRFTLEGIGATWDSPGGGLGRTSENYGNSSFGTSEASEEWLMGRWEAFVTPNLMVVSQGSAGRSIQSAHAEKPSGFEQSFLSPSVWGPLPQIAVDSRYGFTIGNPSRFGEGSYPDERAYEGQEMVDWVRGSLLVRAGFDVSHHSDTTSMLRNGTGSYSYPSVENFTSDALAFAKFGIGGELNPYNQHNCDQTGRVWRDSTGTLRGLGYLPCYSYYSQTMGPTNWYLSTNDWAGYATAQWQPKKLFVVSAGMRWELEQMPPPIVGLANPELPLTGKMPSLGNNLGPRVSMALGSAEGHWPVLRLGYGMYYGRTTNSTLETALTQTGSANGDLKFFMRPTDNLQAGGAPPFPYVPAGQPAMIVKPGAVEFAPGFRNSEVHQAVAAVEESLPGHVQLTASAMVSLGRRLPVQVDANIGGAGPLQTITYNVCDQTPPDPDNTKCGHTGLGPIKAAQITVPFYASWPSVDCAKGSQLNLAGQCGWLNQGYQDIDEITSKANSTYEAAVFKVSRYGRRGLNLQAHYTYSHAMDWNPNQSPLDPANFSEEYGTSSLDVRHSAAAMVTYEAPWKLHGKLGQFGNGWRLSGIGQFHSGPPYTMRTSGSLPQEFTSSGSAITGLAPGMNGSGGDSRVYGMGSDKVAYNIGRNTFRYPATWKTDMRMGKSFDLGHVRRLELLVESFNLFNHQNVTELETTGYAVQSGSPPSAYGDPGTLPSLNFLTGLKINAKTGLKSTAFGQPLSINATNFYRERQIQVGLKVRF